MNVVKDITLYLEDEYYDTKTIEEWVSQDEKHIIFPNISIQQLKTLKFVIKYEDTNTECSCNNHAAFC